MTITNAGTGPSGGALDLVVSDTAGATVPDTGSTLGLLFLSLLALLGATRLRHVHLA